VDCKDPVPKLSQTELLFKRFLSELLEAVGTTWWNSQAITSGLGEAALNTPELYRQNGLPYYGAD
jgi:hypothetical protein